MPVAPAKNFAFIDSTNLYLGIQKLGWRLDTKRFRVYLREHYGVSKAYMFLGFNDLQQDLYRSLQEHGFVLVFKPSLKLPDGKMKGNCDAELVLQAMIDLQEYDRAVLVTGDGDFYCLVTYLKKINKLRRVLAPAQEGCSSLLKRATGVDIAFVSDLKNLLSYKKRTP